MKKILIASALVAAATSLLLFFQKQHDDYDFQAEEEDLRSEGQPRYDGQEFPERLGSHAMG